MKYYRVKTVSLKLPRDLDAKLEEIARRRRTSKSDVIRRALEAIPFHDEEAPRGSALALAGNLVGSVEGPGDLSYSRKYMRRYGR